MTVNILDEYLDLLTNEIYYIYKDKPKVAFKFRKDLLKNLKKDLKQPYNFQKSRYTTRANIHDYVFKGYTSVFEIDSELNIVTVFSFIKHKESL
jgi:mRNA-degrading endonuclease RelE of RelBE toxin-antitoxin system